MFWWTISLNIQTEIFEKGEGGENEKKEKEEAEKRKKSFEKIKGQLTKIQDEKGKEVCFIFIWFKQCA